MEILTDWEVVVQINSARDLKNNSFGREIIKPYVAVYVDPKTQLFTNIDNDGDAFPVWNKTVIVYFTNRIYDAYLNFEVYDAKDEEGVKIGSARIALKGVVDDVGIGEKSNRTLLLKCPSGPPQGTIDVNLLVRGARSLALNPHSAPPIAVSETWGASYEGPRAAPPPHGYPRAAPPPYGYPLAVSYYANRYPTFNLQAPAPYMAATPPLTGYQYTTSPPPYSYGQAPNVQLPYRQQFYGGQAGGGMLYHLTAANTFHQFAENFLGGLGFDGLGGADDTF